MRLRLPVPGQDLRAWADRMLAVLARTEFADAEAVPAGTVAFFAQSAPPAGWLAADGSAISRKEYRRLFRAIGTDYGGGDGSTTFNLPDLRGSFLLGHDGRGARTFGSPRTLNMVTEVVAGGTDPMPDVTLLACVKD